MIKEIKNIEENVDYDKLSFTSGNKKVYGRESFKTFEKFIKDIRNKNMTRDEAEVKQNKFAEKLDNLRAYPARGSKYIDLKESVPKNVKKNYDGWGKIVSGYKNKIFPLSKKADEKTDSDDQQPDILDTPEQKWLNDSLIQIKEEQKNIDMDLFEGVFGYDTPEKLLQTLHSLKRVDSYNQEAFSIKDMAVRFGDRVKKMPEGAEKNKGKKILKTVSKILDFSLNEWKQRGKGLKILTPIPMLSRLPISLAQLKAGNNPEKLKNEIRQLLYSSCKWEKLTKNVYKSLIDII